jgi:hypothetical protein
MNNHRDKFTIYTEDKFWGKNMRFDYHHGYVLRELI